MFTTLPLVSASETALLPVVMSWKTALYRAPCPREYRSPLMKPSRCWLAWSADLMKPDPSQVGCAAPSSPEDANTAFHLPCVDKEPHHKTRQYMPCSSATSWRTLITFAGL